MEDSSADSFVMSSGLFISWMGGVGQNWAEKGLLLSDGRW